MDTNLPKFNIIYSEIIKGITFDFEVEFTLYGEILSISNDFLLESKEAQEARFYDKTSEIVGHLKLAKTLLKYFIPLALMGYLEKKGWKKFKEKFDETITQEPIIVNIDRSDCLLYTSPSPRDGLLSRMPSSA